MSENLYAPEQKKNPLTGWFRQPKIYIKLPSGGKFYPEGALDSSVTGEYPVYAMTAKDELMFKTPDALLSGQSTVEVIKSCIPAILNPWEMPTIDVDLALIAIRIATYGNEMEIGTRCPHCDHYNDFKMDLSAWIGMFAHYQFVDEVEVDPLTVYIRPFSYKELTKTNIKAIEQQKVFAIINDEKMSDEDKIKQFGETFIKLTAMTVDTVANSITRVVTPDGETDDPEFIKEFIANTSSEIFDKISKHITDLKDKIDLKLHNAKCEECEKEFDVPITMDQSNFFAVRS